MHTYTCTYAPLHTGVKTHVHKHTHERESARDTPVMPLALCTLWQSCHLLHSISDKHNFHMINRSTVLYTHTRAHTHVHTHMHAQIIWCSSLCTLFIFKGNHLNWAYCSVVLLRYKMISALAVWIRKVTDYGRPLHHRYENIASGWHRKTYIPLTKRSAPLMRIILHPYIWQLHVECNLSIKHYFLPVVFNFKRIYNKFECNFNSLF